jgi:mRNA-degrading endonuclease RelE of RelBE toxin-antitoxin system
VLYLAPEMATVEIHSDCLADDLGEIRDARAREGILDKIAILEREPGFGRPLRGDLQGHYRITYGRYRIVYRWDRERDHVLVWYIGLRREELYELAEKILKKRKIEEGEG